ncbi:MAG: hypothetical protein EXS15_04250 [Phycisphaerales bacterium]|nr:hypothetical protein [Phycisphaerales bacterium]
MIEGVDARLRAELAVLERPLAHAGYLIGEVRVIDEGTWGRLDAVVEGTHLSGKLQIHLSSKGRISVVPQGTAARAIATALKGIADTLTAPNSSCTPPAAKVARIQAHESTTAPITRTAQRPTSRVHGNPLELVVDCSKYGTSLIGPTEWRGVTYSATGEWRETFHSPVYARGHNNLGEFLAIVDACRRIERGETTCTTLWSDSKTALSWFAKGVIKTTIEVDRVCDDQFAAAVGEARAWLERTSRTKWRSMMHRWDTSVRGENPADFGRK